MSTKIVLAAAVVLSLATGPAFAESDGDPFPFQAPAQVMTGRAVLTDTGSAAYPVFTGDTRQPSTLAQLEPAYGQERLVQTAGSLPRGPGGDTVLAVRKASGVEAGTAQPAS